MPEKRSSSRSKKRLLVDFDTTISKTTGFTHDVSPLGLFIRTIRIPRVGKTLRAVVHLPDGKQATVEGTVVRSYRAPSALRSLIPTGFVLKISRRSREYDEFASSLGRERPVRG